MLISMLLISSISTILIQKILNSSEIASERSQIQRLNVINKLFDIIVGARDIKLFNKEKYFIEIKGCFPAGSVQLIIFNDDEVKQVVYDAVIVSSSKRLLSAKDVIKRLNGVNSSSKCNY